MKKKAQEKILTEAAVEKTFEIRIGFNTADGKRFDVGKEKPHFVFERDFDKDDWSELVKTGAVVHVENPVAETPEEKEAE